MIQLYRAPIRIEDLPEPVQPAYRRVASAWETGFRLLALGVALVVATAVFDLLLSSVLPEHTARALAEVVAAFPPVAAVSMIAGGFWCIRVTERRYTPELINALDTLEASADTDVAFP